MTIAHTGDHLSKHQAVLRKIPFLSGLSDEDLVSVESVVQVRSYAKNQVILLEEDTLKYMYIVFSGRVKAVQTSAEGKEHILAIRGQGEFFGEMGILDGKTSPATIMAVEESEIGLISKDDFYKTLLRHETVLREVILMLCGRLRESWLKLKVLTIPEAEQRVRAVLKLISDQYGSAREEGVVIKMKLTHKDIAEFVSLSRETVTRQLDKLAKAHEIKIIENRQILLTEDFFTNMPFL